MTATNRHRSNETSAPSGRDDASNSQASPSEFGPRGAPPGRCLGVVANAAFYVALLVAVGFAAFHLQRVAEEIGQTSASQEKSARRIAEMTTELDSVSLESSNAGKTEKGDVTELGTPQSNVTTKRSSHTTNYRLRKELKKMTVVKSLVNGLESAMRVTQTKLKGALGQIKRNKLDTRKAEEALQKLQNDSSSVESADSPSPSVSDITSKVESLLSKYDAMGSTLAAGRQEVEAVKTVLKQEMEALKRCLGVLLSNMTALFDAHTELTLRNSNLTQQVEDLQESLGVLEGGSSSVEPDLK